MEAIGAAYEESQTDNQRLMQRLTERDNTESKAVTEKVQAQQLARRLREEKAGLESALVHERRGFVRLNSLVLPPLLNSPRRFQPWCYSRGR